MSAFYLPQGAPRAIMDYFRKEVRLGGRPLVTHFAVKHLDHVATTRSVEHQS